MAEAIDAEIAQLKRWRAEHRARGKEGKIDAAACNLGIATLRRLRDRLGLPNPPHRDDYN